MRYLLPFLIFIFQQSCLAADPKELNTIWTRAISAVSEGRYVAAKNDYATVIEIARGQNMHKTLLAEFLYQAAQASALACDFTKAETLFKESLDTAELNEKSNNGRSEFFTTTWRLFEFAHFYSDRGLYEKSYPYWSKFLPRYEKLNETAARDPIAYSMVLREYGKSLSASGNEPLAEEVLKKSDDIAAKNAELFTRIAWYRYGRNCK